MKKQNSVDLKLGDCLEVLKSIPSDSIDSIVTDPPYGIAFMGKKWDYDVPSTEIWAECLRVLKPGGHLLSFAGTRTQHRMAVRIEDAGFEIRDMIAWVYGSGFPKSLDVSKAIDKMDATEARLQRRYDFTGWMVEACPLTGRQMDQVCNTNTMGRHWTDRPPGGKQPDVPTREYFEMLRPHFTCEVPAWIEEMVDQRTVESENFKRREVVGSSSNGIAGGTGKHAGQDGAYGFFEEFNITSAHTPEAIQWQGWGTALKPALEPITVARKPLIGTVAANVLKHGTGALNVDGCRVGTEGGGTRCTNRDENGKCLGHANAGKSTSGETFHGADSSGGRWPANFIHDGGDEVVDLLGDSARFFYCAKASKNDRNTGCKETMTWEQEDLSRAKAALSQLQKAISDAGTLDQEESAWSTTLSGSSTMDPSQMDTKCTTETTTRPTTELKTWNCLPHWITSGSTQDVLKMAKENGSSLADCVGHLSQWQQNTTNAEMASALGVALAALKTLQETSAKGKLGNFHSTVKPTDLMRYLVRLVTPPGGTVLDPFMGSGSTGKVCALEGFNFIGCEMDEAYLEIARARIEAAQGDTP